MAILVSPSFADISLRTQLLALFRDNNTAAILCVSVVCATAMVSIYSLFVKARHQYRWTTLCGVILGTIALLQALLMQMGTLVQLAMGATGALIVLISYQLKGKWAV